MSSEQRVRLQARRRVKRAELTVASATELMDLLLQQAGSESALEPAGPETDIRRAYRKRVARLPPIGLIQG